MRIRKSWEAKPREQRTMYQAVSILPSDVLHGKEPKVWRAHKLVPRWQRNTKVVFGGEFSIFYTCSLRAVHIHSYILFIFISLCLFFINWVTLVLWELVFTVRIITRFLERVTSGERRIVCSVLNRVGLFPTPWTVIHRALSVCGIFQVWILEWVAIHYARDSTWDQTVSVKFAGSKLSRNS